MKQIKSSVGIIKSNRQVGTLGIVWVTVMNVLYLNSNYIKIIVSEKRFLEKAVGQPILLIISVYIMILMLIE